MPFTQAEEIQFLHATIDPMEDEVRRIKSSQATLRRRLNDLTSTSRSLPQEIIVDIFSYVCADRRSFRSPSRKIRYPIIQVVSQVCSAWREAAKASPSLWTNLLIEMTTDEWATVTTIDLLRLHIENTGALSLSITLDTEPSQIAMPQEHYTTGRYLSFPDLLFFIFCQNPAKLGSVTIRTYPKGNSVWWLRAPAPGSQDVWRGTKSDQGTYPNLVRLNLDWSSFRESDSTRPVFQGASFPNLRHVFLRCDLTKVDFPFEKLTTLHLSSARAQECFNMLSQCPRLTEFHARSISPPKHPEPPSPSFTRGMITLNSLQKLAWDFNDFRLAVALMTSFRFPSLTTLFCHHNARMGTPSMPIPPDYEMHWTSFLATLPALHCFGYSASNISRTMSENIFKALCQVNVALDELYLWDHITDDWGIDLTGVGVFLRNLVLSDTPSNGTTIPPLINIKSLHLYEDLSKTSSPKVVDLLLEMIESRRNISDGSTRQLEALIFHINNFSLAPVSVADVMSKWSGHQRSRLVKLCDSGFQLWVEKGVSANWIDSNRICGCVGG